MSNTKKFPVFLVWVVLLVLVIFLAGYFLLQDGAPSAPAQNAPALTDSVPKADPAENGKPDPGTEKGPAAEEKPGPAKDPAAEEKPGLAKEPAVEKEKHEPEQKHTPEVHDLPHESVLKVPA